jgi:asparagine synthase (glutamine-hydrolysing)
MCGIAGIYYFNGISKTGGIRQMTESLRHRGPDDEGFLGVNFESKKVYPLMGKESRTEGPSIEDFDQPVNLLLGHRRLSILDLSAAGHQPMGNEDGSLWIVHNGEIYNYLEIRKELERLGHTLRSKTDTEVILHAYEEWGTDCLKRFNGMWAFAIVDLGKNRIFCSRDRVGVKPFYYIYERRQFCFASEIKALLEADNFSVEPNEQTIADYLLLGILDHTNKTFFKNIYQLRPGEYLLLENNRVIIQPYWDINGKEIRFAEEREYSEHFYELLTDSIRLRLRSDVPIGSCLSGGLDSSSIVCLANKLMFDGQIIDPRLVGQRQKTFSSCFEDLAYDERKFIELVIDQTGAEKNYVFPQAKDFYEEMTKLIWLQDEPFGSTSIYAQWDVMRLSKERGVTVLLDGQGVDEMLAGYTPAFYYFLAQFLARGRLLRWMKEIKAFRDRQDMTLSRLLKGIFGVLLPSWGRVGAQKMTKTWTVWANKTFQNHCLRPFARTNKFEDALNNYLYQAFRFVALPGLLHYEDRNSMAFSLETRLPFLDFRLVEYLFSLPPGEKIKDGVNKVVLRNAMKGILPEAIRNRTDKMGFATPEDIWFRTVLRKPIHEMIHSKSFAERGYFNIEQVKKAFDQHCQGKTNIHFTIWRWINIEMWFRAFIDRGTSGKN